MILGSRKQKADTRCMKDEVGPPWCHAFLIRPEIVINVLVLSVGIFCWDTLYVLMKLWNLLQKIIRNDGQFAMIQKWIIGMFWHRADWLINVNTSDTPAVCPVKSHVWMQLNPIWYHLFLWHPLFCTCRSGQDTGRVQWASGQVVSQLVAVIGQVTNLEHETDKEEGQEHHPRPHQAHVQVELQVGLLVLGPGQGNVCQKSKVQIALRHYMHDIFIF